MTDFRQQVYEHYVSAEHVQTGRTNWGWNRRAWVNRKYGPVLRGLEKKSAILDLGCGNGEFLAHLTKSGFTNVYGIDISPEQIAIANAKNIPAALGDAFQYLSQHVGTFDVIFAIDFVEHFRKDELIPLLSVIANSLKPSGKLLIQTPNGEGLQPGYVIYGDLSHLTILNSASLNQLLKLAGFSKISVWEAGPAFPVHFPFYILWQLIRAIATLIKLIEIGRFQRCWTENIICSCQKTFPR